LLDIKDHPKIVIFSDLDGTLLTSDTYRWEDAEPAIELCKKLNIPIVLVSSKTKAEIEVIREEMVLGSPFISENGGAIFMEYEGAQSLKGAMVKKNGRYKKLELGTPYKTLIEALRKIRDKLGWNIKGFSDMSVEEIAYFTGMDLNMAYLPSLREYDEPFLILEEIDNISPLIELAEEMGLRVFKGGRFYHLQGKNDKGKAIEILISCYKKNINDIVTVGLGDSPNDFPMLKKVDYPILISSSECYLDVPKLKISKDLGPKGWNKEVIGIIKKLCK